MQRKHSSSSNACIRNVVFNTGMEEVARILQSISSAASGIRVTFQEERNFRIECVVAFLVILGALVVRVSLLEMAVLALAIGLVLALELVNTTLERLTDSIEPRHSPYLRVVKDCMAAAVLVASLSAMVVGICVGFSVFIGR